MWGCGGVVGAFYSIVLLYGRLLEASLGFPSSYNLKLQVLDLGYKIVMSKLECNPIEAHIKCTEQVQVQESKDTLYNPLLFTSSAGL